MSHYAKLCGRMRKELDDIAAKDTFCACDLDHAYKLIESIHGLDEMLDEDAHPESEPTAIPAASEGHADHLTMEQAKKWVSSMRNADGSTGPHWSYEAAYQIMTQRKIDCNPVDFWVTLDMMYSDYCAVTKEHGVDTPAFYADMAAAFLHDEDAVKGKLSAYRRYVADTD